MPNIELIGIRVAQTMIAHLEARGPIVGALAVNFENGNTGGTFGIVNRLSSKQVIIIPQRPTEQA